MPTPTYTALATRTLTGTAASVTFSSIPATYRDLVVVYRGTSANTGIGSFTMRFNSDAATNYSYMLMDANAAGVTSPTNSFTSAVAGLTISSSQNISIAHIMDYSATDKHKTVIARGNAMGDSFVRVVASRWANTAAITSILCRTDQGSNFNSGATFSLYGIIS
jgi:hypothetical protein